MVEQAKQDQPSRKRPAAAAKEPERNDKAAAAAMMPLFYKNPRPLDPARHSAMSLKTEMNFGFARTTNSVPLNVVEFFTAARHFPIVFMTEPFPSALAVLGVRQDENLFVDERGQWQNDSYIPAYVRRYPFIFFESDDRQTLSLCIDEAAGAPSISARLSNASTSRRRPSSPSCRKPTS
ncbi:MAG: SapC family protein [Alphaproteobacteria bacterium]|nr:SapC family protein [Alphaproteobacteria bacterium]